MDLKVSRQSILSAVEAASRAASNNQIMPVLGAVLLSASDRRLSVRGTRLDTEVEAAIDADIVAGGAVALPATLLRQILSSLAGEWVHLSAGGSGMAHITDGTTHFDLAVVPPDDFPKPLHPASPSLQTRLPAGNLAEAIRRVLHAASKEDNRPNIAGVRLIIAPGGATAVATDGARLAIATLPAEEADAQEPYAFTIPSKTASDLATLLDAENTVLLTASQEVAEFEASLRLSTRTLPHPYPAWSDVVQRASENPTRITAPAATILSAVKLAALTAGSEVRTATLNIRSEVRAVTLDIRERNVTLSSETPELGRSTVPLEATVDGPPARVHLNSTYLVQALTACREAVVTIAVGTPNTPVLVQVQDGIYTEVIAPIRTVSQGADT